MKRGSFASRDINKNMTELITYIFIAQTLFSLSFVIVPPMGMKVIMNIYIGACRGELSIFVALLGRPRK